MFLFHQSLFHSLQPALPMGVAALGINHGANTTLQGIDKGVETQEKPSPT